VSLPLADTVFSGAFILLYLYFVPILVEEIWGHGVWEDRNFPDDDMAEGCGYGISYGTPLYEQESIMRTMGEKMHIRAMSRWEYF
jgi:hypothetical protein